MAKEREENLFDGIEITQFMDKEKDPNAEVIGDTTIYSDGTFEVNESESDKTETPEETEKVDESDKTETSEETEKIKDKKAPPDDEDSESSPSSPYLAFAEHLSNGGVFKKFDDKEWKELVDEHGEDGALFQLNLQTINSEIEKRVNQYKESLTPEDRRIYEAKEQNLPLDVVGNIDRGKKVLLSSKDKLESDEDVQKDLIRMDLKIKGHSDEDIEEDIKSFEETNKLKIKAQRSYSFLEDHFKKEEESLKAEIKKREESEKIQREEKIKKIKETIDTIPEILPGIKIKDKERQELSKSIFEPVAYDESGNPLSAVQVMRAKNPMAFELAVHYYTKIGLFNIDDKGRLVPDLSKITGKVETKQAEEFRKKFEASNGFKSGASVKQPNNKETKNLFNF